MVHKLSGKGDRSRWIAHSSNNHYLDSTSLMLFGAELVGCGLFAAPPVAQEPRRSAIISAGRTNQARW